MRERLHRGGDAGALDVALERPFLVAERPGDDARVVAIAADHALELAQLLRAHPHEAVLVEHQQAEAVAGVEKLGRRGVVRGTIGVHSNFL